MKRLVIIQLGSRAMRNPMNKLCKQDKSVMCRRDVWGIQRETCSALVRYVWPICFLQEQRKIGCSSSPSQGRAVPAA